MHKLLTSLALAGALLSGCSNVCDRASSFDPNSKKGDCDITIGKKVDKAACEEKLKSCSSDDEKKLNETEDCFEGVAACQKGKEADFLTALSDCAKKEEGVSDACKQALSSQ